MYSTPFSQFELSLNIPVLTKASSSILVTLLGMVTEVKEVQSSKAQYPILVTLLGMVTEVKEEQL
jgi:hypothetical protein